MRDELRRRIALAAASGGALLRSELRRFESRVQASLAKRYAGEKRTDDGDRPFTADQRQLLEVLALIVIPKDELGPGADEANVVATIEERLIQMPSRRVEYLRGLKGFDDAAKQLHGVGFLALTAAQQAELFQNAAEGKFVVLTRIAGQAGWRLSRLYQVARHPQMHLVPVLIQDVFEAFYSHPVSWEWLGYDGPPMPLGYPDVTQHRDGTAGAASQAPANPLKVTPA